MKTNCMKRVELEDALRRSGPRRDIRDILAELFLTVDSCAKLAALIEVAPATLSEWLSEALRGRVEGAGVIRRLVFAGYETEVERRDRELREDPTPERVGSR